jgi:hypothetical protein
VLLGRLTQVANRDETLLLSLADGTRRKGAPAEKTKAMV